MRRTTQILAPRFRQLVYIAAVAIMASAACAPASPSSRPEGAQQAPATPKLLRVGIASDAEPKELGLAFGNISAGGSEPRFMLHAPLSVYDEQGALQPRIAQRIPTVENGDWKVLPDGRMEVTWKLRPDVRWHDGAPLTAEDLVFGFKVGSDPELAVGTATLRQIAEVAAPDAQTLIVNWKNINIYGNAMGLETIVAMPRHKLAALWEAGDKQAFSNSPAFAEDWTGLGPYKMREWLRGSFIEMVANDDYFLGRPKIDRVSMRYLGDTRGLLVAIMSGDVDLVPVGSLKEEEAHVIRTQWEYAGSGSVTLTANKLRHGQWQFRDPNAPWAQDARVRQALLHLIDRQAIAETVQNGLSEVDDITLPRSDPAYRLAQQQGLPKFPYDLVQAHRLLADAGMSRGADGMYRMSGGQLFATEISTTGDINSNVQEMLAVSNHWKTAGVEPNNVIISGAMDKDQVRSNLQGVNMTSSDLTYRSFDAYTSSEISSQATRWRGANPGAYTNPAYDQLVGRLYGSIDGAERNQIAAQLIKINLEQMLYLPMTYSNDVSAARKELRGLTGVQTRQRVTAWNAHLWELG